MMNARKFLKQYDKLMDRYGSQRAVAEITGVPRTTIQEWLKRKEEILFTERPQPKPIQVSAPKRGVKRFIFTAAQSESAVHEPFLLNLEAYARYLGAELHIAGFTYEKRLYEENRKDVEHAFYPKRLIPYMTNSKFNVGDDLVFCGNMNTLPTAGKPLAGFEVYTQNRDGIFPHAKVQLVSVPTMKDEPAKILMTTGAVTKRNYIQRRAGILAEFHHIIGAVLVELDQDGDHFCRHLLGDEINGSFQDLDIKVVNGEVTEGNRVESITWGDIHIEELDEMTAGTAWGLQINGMGDVSKVQVPMLDALRPREQHIHDIIDFRDRNHHNYPHDPHFRYKQWFHGHETVEDCAKDAGEFLQAIYRPWCQTKVVRSNHDEAFDKWLKNADWKSDPPNALFYLEAQAAKLRALQAEDYFSVLEWSMGRTHPHVLDHTEFLRADKSHTVANGKIECGMHGHLGANGAKASPEAFARMGRRANIAHFHGCKIIDGIYVAGTSSHLDLGYNSGLSSWSSSHIVTHDTGRRQIVTFKNGKFRA